MKQFVRGVFSLSDLRYPWILLISMLLFLLSLYNNRINPHINSTIELATYGTAIACAFVWSILNYVDHIKINAVYKRTDNIDIYVDSLIMNKQEKEDLKAYLFDFVKDLEANGKSKEEAIKTAIGQFQVQEFTSLSKNSGIFELPVHYYLFGYIILFIAVILATQILLNTIFNSIFLLSAVIFTSILYAVAFFGLFFLYKLIDIFVAKKVKQ